MKKLALLTLVFLGVATPAFAATLDFSPNPYNSPDGFVLSGDDALYLGLYYIGDTEIDTPCFTMTPGQRVSATILGSQSVPGTYTDLLTQIGLQYEPGRQDCDVPEGTQFALFDSNDADTSCINWGDPYDTCVASGTYLASTTFAWGTTEQPTPPPPANSPVAPSGVVWAMSALSIFTLIAFVYFLIFFVILYVMAWGILQVFKPIFKIMTYGD